MFLIIVNVLGHPKEVGGLTLYFRCGGGMDLFWNDPLAKSRVDITVYQHEKFPAALKFKCISPKMCCISRFSNFRSC